MSRGGQAFGDRWGVEDSKQTGVRAPRYETGRGVAPTGFLPVWKEQAGGKREEGEQWSCDSSLEQKRGGFSRAEAISY